MIIDLFIVDQATTKALKSNGFLVDLEIKTIISWTVPWDPSQSHSSMADWEIILKLGGFIVDWENVLKFH